MQHVLPAMCCQPCIALSMHVNTTLLRNKAPPRWLGGWATTEKVLQRNAKHMFWAKPWFCCDTSPVPADNSQHSTVIQMPLSLASHAQLFPCNHHRDQCSTLGYVTSGHSHSGCCHTVLVTVSLPPLLNTYRKVSAIHASRCPRPAAPMKASTICVHQNCPIVRQCAVTSHRAPCAVPAWVGDLAFRPLRRALFGLRTTMGVTLRNHSRNSHSALS